MEYDAQYPLDRFVPWFKPWVHRLLQAAQHLAHDTRLHFKEIAQSVNETLLIEARAREVLPHTLLLSQATCRPVSPTSGSRTKILHLNDNKTEKGMGEMTSIPSSSSSSSSFPSSLMTPSKKIKRISNKRSGGRSHGVETSIVTEISMGVSGLREEEGEKEKEKERMRELRERERIKEIEMEMEREGAREVKKEKERSKKWVMERRRVREMEKEIADKERIEREKEERKKEEEEEEEEKEEKDRKKKKRRKRIKRKEGLLQGKLQDKKQKLDEQEPMEDDSSDWEDSKQGYEDGEQGFEVGAVLDHKGTPHRKKAMLFKIRWTGREREERRSLLPYFKQPLPHSTHSLPYTTQS